MQIMTNQIENSVFGVFDYDVSVTVQLTAAELVELRCAVGDAITHNGLCGWHSIVTSQQALLKKLR